jgi:hypothetical protein
MRTGHLTRYTVSFPGQAEELLVPADNFADEALESAFAHHGADATISLNLTRGVSWRCGPWIED